MSFSQELKDFSEGFKSGAEIGGKWYDRQQKWEKDRRFGSKPGDEGSVDDPFRGAGAPAIPDTSSTSSTGGGGTELAWKEADPYQKALLQTIAGPESAGAYDVIYGGNKFTDFKDHPRQDVRIEKGPNAGKTSSAAGKYQFIGSTWDRIAKNYHIEDFSPANQDKAAWYLATEEYGQKTGRDLHSDLKSGDPKILAGIGPALKGQWTSLPGGIEQGQNVDKFVSTFNNFLNQPATDTTKTASAEGALPEPDQQTTSSTTQASGKFVAPQGEKRKVYTPDTQVTSQSLETIDPNLRKVTEKAIADNPGLFQYNPYSQAGKRTPEQQAEMVKQGYSKTMKSKHVEGKGLDLVPINPNTGKADPDYTPGYDAITKAMRKAADDLGVKDLKWGGDWKSFKDRPHWEVSMLEQQQQPEAGGSGFTGMPQEAQPVMFAAQGGVIPEPTQFFASGGWTSPNQQQTPAANAQTASNTVSGQGNQQAPYQTTQGWLNYGQQQPSQSWGGSTTDWADWNTGGASTAGPSMGYNRDNPNTSWSPYAPPTAGGTTTGSMQSPGWQPAGGSTDDYGEYQNWLAQQPSGTTPYTYEQWKYLNSQIAQNNDAAKAYADAQIKAAADKAAADKAIADKAAADKAAADKAAADKAAADKAAADKAAADKAAADKAAKAAADKAAKDKAAKDAAAKKAAQDAAARAAAQKAAQDAAAAAAKKKADQDRKNKISAALQFANFFGLPSGVSQADLQWYYSQPATMGSIGKNYSNVGSGVPYWNTLGGNTQYGYQQSGHGGRAEGGMVYPNFAEGGVIPEQGDINSWTQSNSGADSNFDAQSIKPAGQALGGFGGSGWGTLGYRRDQFGFAEGGRVPNRDELFQKYLREESGRGDIAGESARDRAAKRLSHSEGRPTSSAYDSEYFRPRRTGGGGAAGGGGGRGGKGKPDTIKTSSTTPELQEDRATRFRKSELDKPLEEDRATRFRKGEIEDLGEDRATRFRPPPPAGRHPPNPEVGTPEAAIPMPSERDFTTVPYGTAGTPTEPYEPRPGEPMPRERGIPTVPYGTAGTPVGGYDPGHVTGGTPEGAYLHRPSGTPVGGYDPGHVTGGTPPADYLHRPSGTDTSGYEPSPYANQPPPPAVLDWIMKYIGRGYEDGGMVSFAPGGAVPDEEEYGRYPSGRAAEAGYTTSAPGYRGGASSADQGEDDQQQENYHSLEPTPKLMKDVSQALHGGMEFIKRHFALEPQGGVPAPEDGAARQDGVRRFASGEGQATPQEIQDIDQKVDPDRQLNEGDRQLTRLGKAFTWYQQQGRKEDSQMAAASLLQYGATKFSQLGYWAQAAYENYQQSGNQEDLDKTVQLLQKAYEMIPDGARIDAHIENGKIISSRTNADGEEESFEVTPEDLPGLLEGVQNKSAYWQSVMRVADPEGYRSDLTEKRQEQRDVRTEHRQDKRQAAADKRQDDRQAAADALQDKRLVFQEGQATKRQESSDKAAKQREKWAFEREQRAADRRDKIDAAKNAKKDVDWETVDPLISAAEQADNEVGMASEDNDTEAAKVAQDNLDKALSQVFDALPPGVNRYQYIKDMGFDKANWTYVGGGKGGQQVADVPADVASKYPNAQRNKHGVLVYKADDGKYHRVPEQ